MALDENILNKLEAASAEARVVFWEDAKGEFADDVEGLVVPGAEVLVARGNGLALKRRVLRQEPEGRFVIYRAGGAPVVDEDFLLGIKAFAKPFSAAQSASWADELGLPAGVAPALAPHAEFFRSKERRRALAALVAGADWLAGEADAAGVELAMVAVCCGASDLHRIDAYRSIAIRMLEQWAADDDSAMRLVSRCGLEGALWSALSDGFGYSPEAPGVEDFAYACVLAACSDLTGDAPTMGPDVNVMLSTMANDQRRSEAFKELVDRTCGEVAKCCDLEALPLDVLVAHRVLPNVDDVIARRLAADVETRADVAARVAEVRGRRASAPLSAAWLPAYDALAAASEILSGEAGWAAEAKAAETPGGLFSAYADGLWRMDRAYRAFTTFKAAAHRAGIECLDKLGPQVEASYARSLGALAVAWQDLVMAAGKWPPAEGIALQRRFYDERVRVAMGDGPVAVVVSDALRHEAGLELAERLRAGGKLRVDADAMLSALPSYTQLGMAALLPGSELSCDPGTQRASVDGVDATGVAARQKILAAAVPGAAAVSAKDVLAGEAAGLRGAGLAYVYHNRIDLTGDKRDSETETFRAVSDTMGELCSLVSRLGTMGFATVFVTADHGFIYQQDPASFEAVDFPLLSAVTAADDAKHSRRFLMAGQVPPEPQLIVMGAAEAGLAGDFQVAVPKGTRRLRLQGSGALFVHGGMTLQETVVPCLRVRAAKGAQAARPVGFDLLTGGQTVITGASLSFEVFQAEPVGEGVLPVSLRASLVDHDGKVVSEAVAVELASASADAAERRFRVTLFVGTGVANGAELTLRLERRVGATSRYLVEKEAKYKVRRNFGMDF
ncbi:BREX-1 system phosphatase PglZ type A [Paratractidigestivibacter sp.]|uniref:BREX-1 system phosphatase PglZ type A n=1 Tax=Paratractidigestivibacter sp. TaxID=2847316 RepID=UPI002ACB1766|nr:BREX-1 system phosphatase PglZ type A [Paratractidigestivibacter sp.]